MDKKEIITIAGKPGSGKSTTANIVATTLGFDRYSSGDFMRTIAERRDISIQELNTIAESDHTIDAEVDGELTKIGENKNRLVIDSRLAFHWIPTSFKVYLELDLRVAAERIFGEDNALRRAHGESANSKEEMYESVKNRFLSEQRRYQDLYHINPHQHSYFDLIVNTTDQYPEAVAEKIVSAYKQWLLA